MVARNTIYHDAAHPGHAVAHAASGLGGRTCATLSSSPFLRAQLNERQTKMGRRAFIDQFAIGPAKAEEFARTSCR
jgi:hypothetical protein